MGGYAWVWSGALWASGLMGGVWVAIFGVELFKQ